MPSGEQGAAMGLRTDVAPAGASWVAAGAAASTWR